MKHFKIGDHRI